MELDTFADAIKNNSITIVTINDGYQSLRLAHMIMDDVNHNLNLIQENK